MRAQTSAPATTLNVAASLLSVTRYPPSTPPFSPSFVFLSLQIPPSRSLTRTMLCFHALTNPSASNSFVFTSIQNAGVSLSNPRPALGAFATDRAKSFRCHTSEKCSRNSFPCHTSENTGVGQIMVNQQQRGCPDLTNRIDQHSVRHHGRWVHRFDFHATF